MYRPMPEESRKKISPAKAELIVGNMKDGLSFFQITHAGVYKIE